MSYVKRKARKIPFTPLIISTLSLICLGILVQYFNIDTKFSLIQKFQMFRNPTLQKAFVPNLE